MKLSVIIVNYNVKFFLEQCLFSVLKALQNIIGEIIVIDNCSVDGSEVMIRNKFPQVKLIVNHQNVGFARANNQALKIATGEYVLLLNPDTVVEESTFARCIEFMDEHQDAGALGPKMIDGKGNFLPESKRGLPTPAVAFYKIFGLARLFPHSATFAKYYLGNTSIDETQIVEILTGAFMFLRHSTIENIGYLDESFFMFGEDIDYSHRIVLSGSKNYYFPAVSIIHYKGESTKKGSLNYVMIFYEAMRVFVNKYFTGGLTRFFSLLIYGAIYFRAALSLLKRSFSRILTALLDGILMYATFYLVSLLWERFYFNNPNYYPEVFKSLVIPVYVSILVISSWITGGYSVPFSLKKAAKGIVAGAVIILVVYALLPHQFRFSRAVIVFGVVFSAAISLLTKYTLSLTGSREFSLDTDRKRHVAIVGSVDECKRVQNLLRLSGVETSNVVNVYSGEEISSEFYLGSLSQLTEIIAVYKIDEIIFCARDVSSSEIIKNMTELSQTKVDFKIASPDSESVIGSNSSNTSGDLYVIKVDHKIGKGLKTHF